MATTLFRATAILVTVALAVAWATGRGTGAAVGENRSQPPSPTSTADYVVVELALPRGNPDAGRQAFIDLRCTACHRVAGETDWPAPVSDAPGPDLGPDLAAQPLGQLATAIVAPSHAMSIRTSPDARERVEGVLSPMGDFSEVMTVRQLASILAFLDRARSSR